MLKQVLMLLSSLLALHADGEPVGVGAAFLVDGFVYAVVALVAAMQLVRNCCRYRPWTVQKMIHLLLFAATASTFRTMRVHVRVS